MDNLTSTRVLFGGEAPPSVAAMLEQAMQAYGEIERAEQLLWQAHQDAPQVLPVYFALYKFYFYKGDLENAELATRMALQEAASQGSFPADWRRVWKDDGDWGAVDSPAHFYLFSLKALAFIRLRRCDRVEAWSILDKLAELDPVDTVGASVIRSIAEGVC